MQPLCLFHVSNNQLQIKCPLSSSCQNYLNSSVGLTHSRLNMTSPVPQVCPLSALRGSAFIKSPDTPDSIRTCVNLTLQLHRLITNCREWRVRSVHLQGIQTAMNRKANTLDAVFLQTWERWLSWNHFKLITNGVAHLTHDSHSLLIQREKNIKKNC